MWSKIKGIINNVIIFTRLKASQRPIICIIGAFLLGVIITSALLHTTGALKWVTQTGTLVQWVSALGSLLAVFTTIFLYHNEHKTNVIINFQVDPSGQFRHLWQITAMNKSRFPIALSFVRFVITEDNVLDANNSIQSLPDSPSQTKLQKLEPMESTKPYELTFDRVHDLIKDTSSSSHHKFHITITFLDEMGRSYSQSFPFQIGTQNPPKNKS